MKIQEKIDYLKSFHWKEWLSKRTEIEIELSNQQTMFCCCGKLATGLHERNCRKFIAKVDGKTANQLKHLIKEIKTE